MRNYDKGRIDGYERMWKAMFATKKLKEESLLDYFKRTGKKARCPLCVTREYLKGFEDGVISAARANTVTLTGRDGIR